MSGDHSVGRTPRVSDEEILTVLQRVETPVSTTAMVAEELPIGRRAALNRLTALSEAGRIESMSVGSHGKIWWVSDESEDEPAYLKSFGKYEGTDIADSVAAVAERFDEDARAHRNDLSGQ